MMIRSKKKKDEKKANTKQISKKIENKSSSWSDLPFDILSEVSDRLPYPDFVRIGAVCKSWQAVADKRRRSNLLLPCLIYPSMCRQVEFLDLKSHRIHSIKLKRQEVATRELLFRSNCHASKHGWLLYSEIYSKIKKFFFYNPFSDKVINVPPLVLRNRENGVRVATFTTPPTSHDDCLIFAVVSSYKETLVCTIRAGNDVKDKRWSILKVSLDGEVKDVTYMDGVFYCIIQIRRTYTITPERFILGAFDVRLKKWVIMQDDSASLILENSNSVHLVESNKELLLAVRVWTSTWISVYQFNWSRKDWSTVKGWGNQALILSLSSSMASPAVGKDSEFAGMIILKQYFHGRESYAHIYDHRWNRTRVYGS